jgi:hypothetical protein
MGLSGVEESVGFDDGIFCRLDTYHAEMMEGLEPEDKEV